MTSLRDIGLREPCDRCGHESRRHASVWEWSVCKVKDCPCDSFEAVPKVSA